MKFAVTALFAGIAAAAPAAVPATADAFETVTISGFSYAAVNGYPELSFHIHSQHVDNVHCGADHFKVGGVYSCDDINYTFKVVAEQGSRLTLTHVLNGPPMSGDFVIKMNGPIPTSLQQIGTSTADLDKETSA